MLHLMYDRMICFRVKQDYVHLHVIEVACTLCVRACVCARALFTLLVSHADGVWGRLLNDGSN